MLYKTSNHSNSYSSQLSCVTLTKSKQLFLRVTVCDKSKFDFRRGWAPLNSTYNGLFGSQMLVAHIIFHSRLDRSHSVQKDWSQSSPACDKSKFDFRRGWAPLNSTYNGLFGSQMSVAPIIFHSRLDRSHSAQKDWSQSSPACDK